MRENLQILLDWILELPPWYLYAFWACAIVVVAFVLWPRGNPNADDITVGVRNEAFRFEAVAEQQHPTSDLHEELLSHATPSTRMRLKVSQKLPQLEAFLVRNILDDFPVRPEWISERFSGSGIDRAAFQPRFSSSSIQVHRWQTSENAPRFNRENDGAASMQKFVWSTFEPWRRSRDFRVSIQPYKTTVDGQKIQVGLFVECFGEISEVDGRQATAIWNSDWIETPDGLVLQSLSVIAQEEVATFVPGGQLFRDSTATMLKRTECLERQLVYGLDQWARQIPGIDIVGEQGVAVSDVNGDGLDDLYLCQPHGLPNLLLIQNPDGTVEDVGGTAGVDFLDQSHGALLVDLDNDRDQDLVVTCDEGLLLVSNQGGGKFQLEHVMPIGRGAGSISAADYDQDGDLDLFLCKSLEVNRRRKMINFPEDFQQPDGGRNVLLRNDEGWEFVDVTEQVGITTDNRDYSRCALWLDIDHDGDQDLYVSNEFGTDRIYRNADGWFGEISHAVGVDSPARHRTVSSGEFNGDGEFDFFVANAMPPSISEAFGSSDVDGDEGSTRQQIRKILTSESQVWFSNPGNERLRPFFLRAPLFASGTSFGSVATDVDNDGRDDVVVTNGFLSRVISDDIADLFCEFAFQNDSSTISENGQTQIDKAIDAAVNLCRSGYSLSGRERNRCYLSLGNLGFANISAASGMDLPEDARSVATTDWDNDGDSDVVMTCRSGPQFRIFINQLSRRNRFLSLQLIGTKSNSDAIGSTLELFLEGREAPLIKTLQAGSGFLSQSSKQILFGLGEDGDILKLVITWPNGERQTFENMVANTSYRVIEGKPELAEVSSDRFEIEIGRSTLRGVESTPPVGRSILYPRLRLPRIMFQGATDQFYWLDSTGNQPLLAIFCDRDQQSTELLAKFRKSAKMLLESELDCIALYCDSSVEQPSRCWKDAETTLSKLRFPFRWGALTAASMDKLKLVFGEWFSYQQLPQLPFALLMDREGRAMAYYPLATGEPSEVIEDLKMVDLSEQDYRTLAVPFPGRWAVRYRFADYSRLIARLRQAGYTDDADELLIHTTQHSAHEFCHMAIESIAQNDLEQARQFLDQATETDSNYVMAHVQSGQLLRKLAGSADLNNQSGKTDNLRQAATDFDRALAIDPLNAEAIIGRANVAIEQGNLDEATTKLLEYLELDPKRYEVHAILGRLLFYQRKNRQAAEHLVTAFDNRPSLPYVAGDLGYLYLVSGEYKLARKFLQLANRQQPSDINLLRLLAEAEFFRGNYEAAMDLLERTIVDDPTLRRPKIMLAWLLATCNYESRRDGKRCVEIMQPLVDIAGGMDAQIIEIFAAGLAESGEFDQALELQNKAIALIENNRSATSYTSSQKEGMLSRRELYLVKRPYRIGEFDLNPLAPPVHN